MSQMERILKLAAVALTCIKREISDLRKTQRYMVQGLEHEFLFDKD